MNRRVIGLALITLISITVIALSASSIDSTPIESGFGIEGGSAVNASGDSSSDVGDSSATSGGGTGSGGLFGGEIGDEGDSESDSGSNSLSSLFVLAVFLGVAAAGVMLIFWSTDDATTLTAAETTATEPESPDDSRPVAHGPHTVDSTNDVYAAWWEMTRQLNASHPQSRTPVELATAAIDAGMAPEAVNDLTTLFTDVRYGNARVTADRERQANDALDRLQLSTAADRGESD